MTNKYANTLTVASAQKNSRYKKHILDAIENVCCTCPTVLSAVDHFAKKCNARHEKERIYYKKLQYSMRKMRQRVTLI